MKYNLRKLYKNKFIKDSIYNMFALAVVIVAGVLINIFLGNKLGVETLGAYTYSFTIYIILSTFTNLGIKNSAIKYIAEVRGDKLKEKLLIQKYFYMSLILFILSLILYLIILMFINLKVIEKTYLAYALVGVPFNTINNVYEGIYAGLRKMKKYAVIRSLRWILIATFIIVASVLKFELNKLLLCFLMTELVLLMFILMDLIKKFNLQIKMFQFKEIRKLFSFGFKTVLNQSINQIDNKMSLLITGLFLSDKDLGLLGYASTMAVGITYIPGVIGLNFSPIISNLWNKNKQKLKRNLYLVKRLTALATLLSTILISAVYPLFVKITMKEQIYVQSFPIFYILLMGSVFISYITPYRGFLAMIGKPEKILVIRAITITLNLLFSLIFINLFGLLGAAIATMINNIILALILNNRTNHELKDIDVVK